MRKLYRTLHVQIRLGVRPEMLWGAVPGVWAGLYLRNLGTTKEGKRALAGCVRAALYLIPGA